MIQQLSPFPARQHLAAMMVFAISAWIMSVSSAFGQSQPVANPAVVDDSYISAWRSVDRWLLEYEARVVAENETGELGRTVHKQIACARPDKFFHFVGHGTNWQSEPFNQLAILNGKQSVHIAPFMRRISIDQTPVDGKLPGTLSQEFAFYIMPMLACSELNIGSDSTMLVLDATNSGRFQIVNENCLVAGEACVQWTATDGTENIWISKFKGPCVMQREHRDKATGQVLQRVQTSQTRQFSGNFWLPVRFSRSLYRVGNQSSQLLQTSEFRVLRFETNAQVPDSLFSWSYDPGMLQRKASGDWAQVSPGGTELLDSYVSYIQNEVYKPAPDQAVNWQVIGGIILLCAAIGMLTLKSWQLLRSRAIQTCNLT